MAGLDISPRLPLFSSHGRQLQMSLWACLGTLGILPLRQLQVPSFPPDAEHCVLRPFLASRGCFSSPEHPTFFLGLARRPRSWPFVLAGTKPQVPSGVFGPSHYPLQQWTRFQLAASFFFYGGLGRVHRSIWGSCGKPPFLPWAVAGTGDIPLFSFCRFLGLPPSPQSIVVFFLNEECGCVPLARSRTLRPRCSFRTHSTPFFSLFGLDSFSAFFDYLLIAVPPRRIFYCPLSMLLLWFGSVRLTRTTISVSSLFCFILFL